MKQDKELESLVSELNIKDLASLKKHLGNIAEAKKSPEIKTTSPSETLPLPLQVDWRNLDEKNYVTPVRNQRFCGACIAFALSSAMESQIRILKQIPINSNESDSLPDLSAAQLIFEGMEGHFKCLRGWAIRKALRFASNTGIVPASDYPYPAIPYLPGSHKAINREKITLIDKYIELDSTEDIKRWLATKGPVVTGFSIYLDFFFYRSGIYQPRQASWNLNLGEHSVLCIGYDDEKQAWIAKNSWGTNWGDGGYFHIAYNHCDFNQLAWGIESFKTIYTITRN